MVGVVGFDYYGRRRLAVGTSTLSTAVTVPLMGAWSDADTKAGLRAIISPRATCCPRVTMGSAGRPACCDSTVAVRQRQQLYVAAGCLALRRVDAAF